MTLTAPEQLVVALAGVAAALDACQAAGLAIPPVAAQGVTSLALAATILNGQQREADTSPLTFAASMADAKRVRAALAPDAPAIAAVESLLRAPASEPTGINGARA